MKIYFYFSKSEITFHGSKNAKLENSLDYFTKIRTNQVLKILIKFSKELNWFFKIKWNKCIT